jgi:hypothetical protein
MKNSKIAMLAAATSLIFAGVASAAAPTVVAVDKVKTFFCANETTEVKVVYDVLTYGNGNGNKVVVTKGVAKVSGPNVGFIDLPIKQSGLDALVGFPNPTGYFVVDVVNGNNTGNYDDETAYTRCTMPVLN